jgi:hypothetical protein
MFAVKALDVTDKLGLTKALFLKSAGPTTAERRLARDRERRKFQPEGSFSAKRRFNGLIT